MNRRDFIKTSLGTGMVLSAVPIIGVTRNQTYRTALIGSGWWGMNILRCAMEAGESKIVAMCDVDQNQLDPAFQEVEKLSGDRPQKYKDYRELLAKEKPQVVIVATPDHWHALCTIAALRAGAHVYVEKPISHTINEGRAMVKAARDYERVVQVGTHRRVSPHNKSGMEFLKSGKAGKIGMVRAFVHYPGGPGGPTPDSEAPPGLDWNMWCGPAPLRPFNQKIHPKGFRQFLDFANGTLADWGIHWMDQILWWTEEKYPRKVFSTGDRHIKKDNTDAPDTQVASFEFESFTAVWEHRRYAGNEAEKTNIGCYFYGTEGTFHMGWRDGWNFYPSKKGEPIIHQDPHLNKPDDQNIRELWADFLHSIKNNRRPACDIEIGQRATNMSLLGMLSLKLGRSVQWDGEKEMIIGDPEANTLLSRPYRTPWKYPEV
ncbi:Gfo/Idh/MocA family oxidoreductase [Acidobacteria bacterium AH-259-L09]|nr:Gfo/Idh/MocA family oxidoreductase [Acidobacteria bacterium AH-259-L09]